LTEENLRELICLVNEEVDSLTVEYRNQIEAATKQIEDLNKRMDRLYDSIERGTITDSDVAPRIRELKGRKEILEKKKWEFEWQIKDRKVELADPALFSTYVEDLRSLLEQSPLTQQKAFIKSFVKNIAVANGKVTLSYTIPLFNDLSISEEISVLSTV
jgi:site-specific DNA recombinase